MNNQLSFLSVRKRAVVQARPRADSPDTKRMKRGSMQDIQERAFRDLVLSLPAVKQGSGENDAPKFKAQYGAVKKIVDRYVKCGHTDISASNLRKHMEYRMRLYNQGKDKSQNDIVPLQYLEISGVNSHSTSISSITNSNDLLSPGEESAGEEEQVDQPAQMSEAATTTDNSGGRKKGTTKEAKKQLETKYRKSKLTLPKNMTG